MSKVLLLGLNPLPTQNSICTLAPGKRAWQFLNPLLKNGHRVCLICSRHLAAKHKPDRQEIKAEEHSNLIYYSVTQSVFEDVKWLQRIHDNFDPDCIVGATVYPSYIATRLNTEKPLWVDLFGHIMAEAQTKSKVFTDNYYVSHLWNQEKAVLDRADVLSVVSEPQSYATIGELGARFRLNRLTTGYQFTHVIPCSVSDIDTTVNTSIKPVLRGVHVPENAFVILWSGGYNTWTDVKTLFAALETVFSRYPHVYFVSTGGEIASHDEITYKQFASQIQASRFRSRFIMRGWIPFNEVSAYVRESNAGINIDLFSYEGVLGSRNRLMDWMQSKLPIITSELCELSYIIKQNSLGLTFQPEDESELIDVLCKAVNNDDLLNSCANNAYNYCNKYFSPSITTEPLQKWVADPRRAPDHVDYVQPESYSIPDTFRHILKHYHASVMNNIRSGGLVHTARWILARTPGFRRFGK
jgi:glycosyltransferase involved in cell wall biosynthesis